MLTPNQGRIKIQRQIRHKKNKKGLHGFDPNSAEIAKATKAYLRQGGKITKVVITSDTPEPMPQPHMISDFLCDCGKLTQRNIPEGHFWGGQT